MKSIYLHSCNGVTEAIGGADSAVLRPGEPLFVAEPLTEWQSIIAPALRISRLGMNIKPSFAGQYYSELAALHLLLPLTPGPIPPLFCDRAIAPGKWLQITPDKGITMSVTVDNIGGDRILDKETLLGLTTDETDNAVAFVSQYMTLKTGDMIIFGDHSINLGPPRLDTQITVKISNLNSLELKIK